MSNRAEVYVEGEWQAGALYQPFCAPLFEPADLAKFYREVYELQELEKARRRSKSLFKRRPRDHDYFTLGNHRITRAPASSRDTWIIWDSESKTWRSFKKDLAAAGQ
jgi:hypothetical protein